MNTQCESSVYLDDHMLFGSCPGQSKLRILIFGIYLLKWYLLIPNPQKHAVEPFESVWVGRRSNGRGCWPFYRAANCPIPYIWLPYRQHELNFSIMRFAMRFVWEVESDLLGQHFVYFSWLFNEASYIGWLIRFTLFFHFRHAIGGHLPPFTWNFDTLRHLLDFIREFDQVVSLIKTIDLAFLTNIWGW